MMVSVALGILPVVSPTMLRTVDNVVSYGRTYLRAVGGPAVNQVLDVMRRLEGQAEAMRAVTQRSEGDLPGIITGYDPLDQNILEHFPRGSFLLESTPNRNIHVYIQGNLSTGGYGYVEHGFTNGRLDLSVYVNKREGTVAIYEHEMRHVVQWTSFYQQTASDAHQSALRIALGRENVTGRRLFDWNENLRLSIRDAFEIDVYTAESQLAQVLQANPNSNLNLAQNLIYVAHVTGRIEEYSASMRSGRTAEKGGLGKKGFNRENW
jgi:hypothetical protein